jgi:hypothetical protein
MVKLSTRPPRSIHGKLASFGSAIYASDFKPLGRRIKLKVGVDHPPLRRPLRIQGTAKRQD